MANFLTFVMFWACCGLAVLGLTAQPVTQPPSVQCETLAVARDSVIFASVYDVPGNQPNTLIELRDAETNTVCRTY